MIYFDYAASAPIRENTLKVLEISFKEDFSNPSAIHKLGKALKKKIQKSRKSILSNLNADVQYDLMFTSSATEANNTVILGFDLQEKSNILMSLADHPSIKEPIKLLKNVLVKKIDHCKSGGIDQFDLLKKIDNETILLALSWINNQSGKVYPIKELVSKIKKINPFIHIHIDAVQALGKIPIDLHDSLIDSLSISAHKIGGPKGIAALIFNKKAKISPLMYGGGQENGFRSSTEPTSLILGFESAFNESLKEIYSNKLKKLKEKTINLIKQEIPEISFPFECEDNSDHILNLLIPNLSSDIIVRFMEMKDIYISTTSACSSKIKGKNEVFDTLGLSELNHKNIIRLSFGYKNDLLEVDEFVKCLNNCYKEISNLVR